MDATLSRLRTTLNWDSLACVDVVIEAVFEDVGVKRTVFARIDRYVRPGALLATNMSYLDIDQIAQATSRPGDVLGLHFFSPANVMKLLEVVRGASTQAAPMATAMALGKKLGKLPVVVGNRFGFIGNRIYNAYRKQCEFMLEDGAWPEDVDDAVTTMGFAMDPFAVADLSGLDIAPAHAKSSALAAGSARALCRHSRSAGRISWVRCRARECERARAIAGGVVLRSSRSVPLDCCEESWPPGYASGWRGRT